MCQIVYSDQLKIDQDVLPIHLDSDGRVWIRFDDLCDFIGVANSQNVEDATMELVRRDLSTIMSPPLDEQIEYIDLAALPFWLGLICGEPVNNEIHYEALLSYSQDAHDVSWIAYSAAEALSGVEFHTRPYRSWHR